MAIISSIIAELEQEAKTTRRVLERLPDAHWDWKPHEKSMPLGKLGHHVATLPGFFSEVALADSFDVVNSKRENSANCAEVLQRHDAGLAAALKNLPKIDDTLAMGNWSFLREGKPMMTMPRIALIRGLLMNHWIHHRGALTVYLRLLNVPVPPIYGPTADENPFT
jgi:uncharacterized damage-inducible protein DinB